MRMRNNMNLCVGEANADVSLLEKLTLMLRITSVIG